MEVGASGLRVQAGRMIQRMRADEEMVRGTPPRPLAQLTYVHEILSCLVAGVYARDREEPDYHLHWQTLGYEPVNDLGQGNAHLHDRIRVAADDAAQAPHARLMLFRRLGRGPYGGNGREPEGLKRNVWPMYVVAIRGTILTRRDDLRDDGRILFETLCETVRLYRPVMRLLLAIHRTYGAFGHVWVAGHSLGATLGLIATRRLTIDHNVVLKTHFFNPPNVSLDVLVKKGFTAMVNGVGVGIAWVLPSSVGGAVNRGIRRAGSFVTRKAEGLARSTNEFLFRPLFDVARRDFNTLQERGYRPHLYMNPNDAICNEYIAHFNGNPPAISNAVPITQLFFDSQSCHLIPAAYLYTNHWARGPHEAHKLHQWYLYPTVNLECERVG